jgi:hypothetical protein
MEELGYECTKSRLAYTRVDFLCFNLLSMHCYLFFDSDISAIELVLWRPVELV